LFTVLRWLRRLLVVALAAAVVYLLVTSAFVITAARGHGSASTVSPATAIVVIGSTSGGTHLSSDGTARCAQAALLYDDKRAKQVVATGGKEAPRDLTERFLLASCMEKRGVPKHAIGFVTAGTVPGQLDLVGARFPRSKGDAVILVADPLETKWLEGLASSTHLSAAVSPAPAPRRTFWSTIGQVWAQTIAVGYGRIFGYGGTSWVKG